MTGAELAMVLTSALLHALWNTFAKGSREPMAYLALLLGGTVVVTAPLLLWMDVAAIGTRALALLAGTSVVHACYNVSLSRALARGDMSVVYPISRSTPAFVALVAVPLFDDPVSLLGGVGISTVVVGVWLVHTEGRLQRHAFFARGVGWAYVTLALTVAYSLVDKQGVRAIAAEPAAGPVPSVVQYFFLLTAGQTVLFLPYAVARVPRAAWRTLVVDAPSVARLATGIVASGVSYGLILVALETGSVSYVTAVRQASVLFAAVLAMIVLRERPGRVRLVGSALTVVGVALVAGFG